MIYKWRGDIDCYADDCTFLDFCIGSLVFGGPYLKPANVCNTLAQYFKKSPHSHWLIKFNKLYINF